MKDFVMKDKIIIAFCYVLSAMLLVLFIRGLAA